MLKIAPHCNLRQPALAPPIAAGTLLAGLGCSPLSGCRKKLNWSNWANFLKSSKCRELSIHQNVFHLSSLPWPGLALQSVEPWCSQWIMSHTRRGTKSTEMRNITHYIYTLSTHYIYTCTHHTISTHYLHTTYTHVHYLYTMYTEYTSTSKLSTYTSHNFYTISTYYPHCVWGLVNGTSRLVVKGPLTKTNIALLMFPTAL